MPALTSPLSQRTIQKGTNTDDARDQLEQSDISGFPFTLDQLRILKAISIAGNFRRAGDVLFISQPTVSFQMNNLEHQLGLRLFDRSGRHNQLTEAGHLVLSYAEKILSLCQKTCRTVHDLQDLQRSSLVFGASHTSGTYLMPKLISLLRQKCPGIKLQVYTQPTPQTCLGIVSDQLDLAIVEGDIPTELQDNLEVIAATQDELVLVVSASHPLAQIETIQPDDLKELELIVLESPSQADSSMHEVLGDHGLEMEHLKVGMKLSCLETIKNAVQANLGVAFVPRATIDKELQLGVLHQIQIKDLVIKQTISVVLKTGQTLTKPGKTFVEEILPQFLSLETN